MTTIQPTTNAVKPISVWQTGLFFGIPGILMYLATYYGVPMMVAAGMPLIWAWTLAVFVPYQPLALYLVVDYVRQPGNTWASFLQRFRLTPLPKATWKVILLAVPIILGLNFSMEWTIPLVAPLFPAAPVVPELLANPYESVKLGGAVGTFFGVPMQGQYWLILFWFVWALLAVSGEELIWRGYLLPRMELSFGRWAWLVNGLSWNLLFHLYTLYNVFTDMPFMLIVPFLAQRTRNTWVSFIIHLLLTFLAFAILIPGVF